MTPKEKAKELVNKMVKATATYANELVLSNAKACALICVGEVMAYLQESLPYESFDGNVEATQTWKHWLQVKEEIKNL